MSKSKRSRVFQEKDMKSLQYNGYKEREHVKTQSFD